MRLPEAFCWTKMGTEAGESLDMILERKEQERRSCDGLFLWGIGNSIRPSVAPLLHRAPNPLVLFSPMLSEPADLDRAPSAVMRWHTAVSDDGHRCPIPSMSKVTSGARVDAQRVRHFALVCHSAVPLQFASLADIDHAQLTNLRSGNRLGSSQVTSVVAYDRHGAGGGPLYAVVLQARLVSPYFVSLEDPVPLSDGIGRGSLIEERCLAGAMNEELKRRCHLCRTRLSEHHRFRDQLLARMV